MKLRNIGYVAFIAATAAAFVIGSGGTSEAKGKKKEAAPPPQTVICFEPEHAGVRGEGRQEVHLRQCLLRR